MSSKHSNQVRKHGGSRKALFLVALLMGFGLAAIFPHRATAGSASALVTVSVRVVESCRLDIGNATQSDSTDVRMRCSPTARPNLGLAGSSQAVGPVGTVTLAHSQIAATENGKTLTIQF